MSCHSVPAHTDSCLPFVPPASMRSLLFSPPAQLATWKRTSPPVLHKTRDGEFGEFLEEMMNGKMGEKDSREDTEKVFKLFDDDNTDKISVRNLARVERTSMTRSSKT